MWMVAGIALINPTSFLLETTRTPQCHWGNQPGGRSALRRGHTSAVTSHPRSLVYLLLLATLPWDTLSPACWQEDERVTVM